MTDPRPEAPLTFHRQLAHEYAARRRKLWEIPCLTAPKPIPQIAVKTPPRPPKEDPLVWGTPSICEIHTGWQAVLIEALRWLETNHPGRPSIDAVLDAFAAASRFNRGDLTGRSRVTEIACIRQVAMTTARILSPKASLPKIGTRFLRHHTTVLCALKKYKEEVSYILDHREVDKPK